MPQHNLSRKLQVLIDNSCEPLKVVVASIYLLSHIWRDAMSRVYSIDDVQVEKLVTTPEIPSIIYVSATGQVPTTGWSHPDLAPFVYIVPPKDGILDMDFVATPPSGLALQLFTKIAVAKAFPVPRWVVGVSRSASWNWRSNFYRESILSYEHASTTLLWCLPAPRRPSAVAQHANPHLVRCSTSKISPFINSAISVAGSGFWHSDNGLSQKFEPGNISNRLRAAAPRQVSGSLT